MTEEQRVAEQKGIEYISHLEFKAEVHKLWQALDTHTHVMTQQERA